MKKEIIIISLALLFSCFIWTFCVTSAVKQIEKVGLKNIVHEVWNGK
jgi:hypothetical protein